MSDEKKDPVKAALEQARHAAERDHAQTQSACADMNEKANKVLERLRKRARPVRLVKANHG